MKLRAHRANSKKTADAGLVVSLHGMNARGTWQKHLASELSRHSFSHEAYDYGRTLVEPLCRCGHARRVQHFMEFFENHCTKWNGRVDVVAHSYGTLVLGRLLRAHPAICFRRLIFFGSILPEGYPWSQAIERRQVKAVLNEASQSDYWVRVAPWLIPGAGRSGCRGFSPVDRVHNLVRDSVGHSDLQYREHYRRVWIPFLKKGKIPAG